uniref:BPTI/Kunitz inhibitor domain-containing protein n=1 Tax=Trichobilharzia regenti TaxID=157069 RepID=A0AA85K5Q3_TRIRE|nr:unnamed protein product [Trichobilharzia regenti]
MLYKTFAVAFLILCAHKYSLSFNSVCFQKMEDGPCRAIHPRYYYNSTVGSCLMFHYGGCHGNQNNFLTKEACQEACGESGRFDPNDCNLPKKTGKCRASFHRYFYDKKRGACQGFTYGGCDGNGNNFQTEEECQAKCGAK